MTSVELAETDKVRGLLRTRARAAQAGDLGVVRACNADLARVGYVDSPRHVPGPAETTEAAAMPERAVPEEPVRRGRPPVKRTR